MKILIYTKEITNNGNYMSEHINFSLLFIKFIWKMVNMEQKK